MSKVWDRKAKPQMLVVWLN